MRNSRRRRGRRRHAPGGHPSNSGRIHAWPNGTSEPTATTFYYGTATGSSGNTVTLNPATAYSFKVRNGNGPTDLVIDVSGYDVKPLAAMINPAGSLYAGSSRAISSTKVTTGIYRLQFDRDVSHCTITAAAYLSNFYASSTGTRSRCRSRSTPRTG